MPDSKEAPIHAASITVAPIEPWALSPKETAIVENCGLTVVYDRIRKGQYEAYTDGNRTKITLESIKRRRASLPRLTPKLRIEREGPAVRNRRAVADAARPRPAANKQSAPAT